MPHHKPLRQLAAEKARGNRPANPSQLGDPIDLKAETSEGSDPPETEPPASSGSEGAVPVVPTSIVSKESALGKGRQKQVPGVGDAGPPERRDPFVSGGGVKGRGSKI